MAHTHNLRRLVAFMAVLLLATSDASRGQEVDSRGYDSLPNYAKWLASPARDGESALDSYNAMTPAERATFEAIVHALEHHNLLGIVDAVSAIWGEAASRSRMTQGRHQFRLSVVLNQEAIADMWESGAFRIENDGHVKLLTGRHAPRRRHRCREGEG